MKISEKCLKIAKTCNLYLSFINLGMSIAVPGPCLMDLKDLVNTDVQLIGIFYTIASIGFLVGSLLSGIILDATKYKQAIMTTCNTLVAAGLLAIPWSTSLGTLMACVVVSSISRSIMMPGANVLCLTLWGDDSGPYIHALHFMFGLGALLAPLIAAPFLGDRLSDAFLNDINNVTQATNFVSTYNYTSATPNAYNITSMQNTSKIVYPFTIIGIYGMVVSAMCLLICIISPTEVEEQRVKSEQRSKHKLRFIVIILVLSFVLYFATCVMELGYSQMLTTYVVNGYLKLPSTAGSYMTSVFWVAFTLSRLGAVFLAIKISHFTIIIVNMIIISIAVFVLVFIAHYEWALWVTSILLGAGVAPLYAASIGWLNVYITLTNRMIAVFGIGASVGGMIIPFTIGYFIEQFPDIFIYIIFAAYILFSLIVLLLFLSLRKQQKISEQSKG